MSDTENTSGFTFPQAKVGNWSMNIVLQALSCCGKDTTISTWEDGGFLGVNDGNRRLHRQKRVGVMGTVDDARVGYEHRNVLYGLRGPLDTKPMVVGLTHRDGFITIYKNGVRQWRGAVYQNAMSYFTHINGVVDATASSNGQIAEIKLYDKPFDDSTMKLLYDKLACKWHLDQDLSPWADCSLAEGKGSGGGGGAWRWGISYLSLGENMREDVLQTMYTWGVYRGIVETPDMIVGSGNYLIVYLTNAEGEPLPLEDQPEFFCDVPGSLVYPWATLESLVPNLPNGEEEVPPGASLMMINAANPVIYWLKEVPSSEEEPIYERMELVVKQRGVDLVIEMEGVRTVSEGRIYLDPCEEGGNANAAFSLAHVTQPTDTYTMAFNTLTQVGTFTGTKGTVQWSGTHYGYDLRTSVAPCLKAINSTLYSQTTFTVSSPDLVLIEGTGEVTIPVGPQVTVDPDNPVQVCSIPALSYGPTLSMNSSSANVYYPVVPTPPMHLPTAPANLRWYFVGGSQSFGVSLPPALSAQIGGQYELPVPAIGLLPA